MATPANSLLRKRSECRWQIKKTTQTKFNSRQIDFITIDFETATSQRDSACEIGLTFVQGGQIVETKSWLIKPRYKEFDYFNMLIHGIRPEHVAGKPEFNEL